MRRILCVWLPYWRTERHRRGATPDRPIVQVATEQGVRRIAVTGPDAVAAGLRSGQSLAEARAICPALMTEEIDPEGDIVALDALAEWAQRYTPLVAPSPPEGLWLDIAGCAHFWGDEAGLLAEFTARLTGFGLSHRVAIADTPGAAWAMAHFGNAGTVLPPGQERVALAPLPIAALRLDATQIAGLARLGLRRIGDLVRVPRAELTLRFGTSPGLRLEQALGLSEEVIIWPRSPTPFLKRSVFAEPIGAPEDLIHALEHLIGALCACLAAAEMGGLRFRARFFRVDASAVSLMVMTGLPIREASYLVKLFAEKLEQLDPGFGVEAILLTAEETGSLTPPQTELLAPTTCGLDRGKLAGAIDVLANRLGAKRIWRAAFHASHVPEHAVRRMTPLLDIPAWPNGDPVLRPLRLLSSPEPIQVTALLPDDPPVQFIWRGVVHRLRAAVGPERIAAEWWHCEAPASACDIASRRDYYRVENQGGDRFWLFRASLQEDVHSTRWFLHGLFA